MAARMATANVSLENVTLQEIDGIIKASKPKYRNRSHFFQVAVENLLAEEARRGGA